MSTTVKAQQYNDELNKLEEQIKEGIIKVRRTRGTPEEQMRTDAVNSLIDQAKKIYTRLSGLLKNEPDQKTFEALKAMKDQHKQEMTKLKNSFKLAIQQNEVEEMKQKKSSIKGASEINNDSVEIVRIDRSTTKQRKATEEEELNDKIAAELFGPVFETQQDCLAIIERLNRKAEETLEIGAESAEILKQQREQLIAIDKKLDELGSNTKRAGRELSSLFRKLATDKLIVVVCILLALVIIVAVIIRIVLAVIPKNNDKKQ